VERPEDIRPALARAFASGLPACVNVMLDPKGLESVQAGKAYVF
jgi:thiamine pyrophosphate-dependent acetolactate synthase large subunit-like protein